MPSQPDGLTRVMASRPISSIEVRCLLGDGKARGDPGCGGHLGCARSPPRPTAAARESAAARILAFCGTGRPGRLSVQQKHDLAVKGVLRRGSRPQAAAIPAVDLDVVGRESAVGQVDQMPVVPGFAARP